VRGRLAKVEASVEGQGDYVARYREYKYQETLFELFSKQFELAKVDESREGALIQVVDPAEVPEKKSKPRRGTIAVVTTLVSGLLLLMFLTFRAVMAAAAQDDRTAAKLQQLGLGRKGAHS